MRPPSVSVSEPKPEHEPQQGDAASDAPAYCRAPLVHPRQKDVVHVGVDKRQRQRNKPNNEQAEPKFFHVMEKASESGLKQSAVRRMFRA